MSCFIDETIAGLIVTKHMRDAVTDADLCVATAKEHITYIPELDAKDIEVVCMTRPTYDEYVDAPDAPAPASEWYLYTALNGKTNYTASYAMIDAEQAALAAKTVIADIHTKHYGW